VDYYFFLLYGTLSVDCVYGKNGNDIPDYDDDSLGIVNVSLYIVNDISGIGNDNIGLVNVIPDIVNDISD
jgi:hypothetical protein